MRRVITSHAVTPDEKLTIQVTDHPGHGGAHHRYEIQGLDTRKNPSAFSDDPTGRLAIIFQNGTVPTVGTNGVTHEALLAIIIDRLACFQAGEYACSENAVALEHLRCAQLALQNRTRKRLERGVEGTHTA
jgi:hypothetical protein